MLSWFLRASIEVIFFVAQCHSLNKVACVVKKRDSGKNDTKESQWPHTLSRSLSLDGHDRRRLVGRSKHLYSPWHHSYNIPQNSSTSGA